MSHLPLVALHVLAASSSSKTKSAGSPVFFLVILAFGAAAYFLFLRPQQQKAKKAREQSKDVEVGDEILTVGGIVGRVLEIEGDRITLLTGEPTTPGTVPEHEPHRLVIVRQAVARKIEPTAPEYDEDLEHEAEAIEGDDARDGPGESGDAPEDGRNR